MEDRTPLSDESIDIGQPVYDGDGRLLGRISGFTEEGFEAESVELDESESEELPGKEFGEGYLMWRCGECGRMGDLEDDLPDTCPDCGAPREAITVVEED